MAFDHFPADLALPGDLGGVQNRAVRKTHRLQKTGETANVPDQALGLDLFAYIQGRIGPQGLFRIRGSQHQRQHSQAEVLFQIESRPQFGRHERVQRFQHGPTCQQIDARPLQLSRAGTGEDELPARSLLHEQMDRIEQGGNFLNFIQHDRPGWRGCSHDFFQPLRPRFDRPETTRDQAGRSTGRPDRSAAARSIYRCRGPKRKKLPSGDRKKRLIVSINAAD